MLPERDIETLQEYCLVAYEARRAKEDYDDACAWLEQREAKVRGILKRLDIPFTDVETGVTLTAAVERSYKPEHYEQAIKDLGEAGLDCHTRTVIVESKTLNRRIKSEGLWDKLKQSFGVYKRPIVRVEFSQEGN